MNIIYFLKSKLKIILLTLTVLLSVSSLSGVAYYYVPKYLEAKQKDRDSTRKCKSYRALAEIAYGLYREDPEGPEWKEKFAEAQKRQAQYKCSPVISISQRDSLDWLKVPSIKIFKFLEIYDMI